MYLCGRKNITMKDNKSTNYLFHGSNQPIPNPEITVRGYYKDFGYGFYCTKLEKQARRWALTRQNVHVVSVYGYTTDTNLNVLSFPVMSDEWLDFVVACRRGIPHDYDIVEGPMADDQIWDYVEDFTSGKISREAFWALAKFRTPTHQIAFCTDKALQTLIFERSYTL